ncbi:MAG: S1 RNA-binding domain-containing protein, partial [Armatimonadetes bacterium]|nr:S1 RNA-binding domain-containing protein [Armatimonadota bacterium]
LRQILPDPWTEVQSRYAPGDIISGTVTRLVPFGAFVQLEGGLEGIIPSQELSSRRTTKPEEVVEVGQEVEVKVLEIRPDERRMTLSLRQAQEERGDFGPYGGDPERVTLGDVYGGLLEEDDEE